MSGFWGGDTEQMRTQREMLTNRSSAITELRARLEPVVLDESSWVGSDADRFREQWRSGTAPMFDRIDQMLGARGLELERHAEEQDEASSVGGPSTGPLPTGYCPAPGPGSPLDLGEIFSGMKDAVVDGFHKVTGAFEVFNKFQKVWSTGKKAWDTLKLVDGFQELLRRGEDVFDFVGITNGFKPHFLKNAFSGSTEMSGLVGKILGNTPFLKDLNLPTGIGNVKFFGWVDDLASKSSFLTKAAPWVGKALPVADMFFGGKQMVEGIQNGDTFSAVTGGANALGGTLMLAGGALSATGVGAAIGGPLLAAGTVISAGSAVADLAKWGWDNRAQIGETFSNAKDAVVDFASDPVGSVKDAAGAVGDAIGTAGDVLSDIGGGLKNAFGW